MAIVTFRPEYKMTGGRNLMGVQTYTDKKSVIIHCKHQWEYFKRKYNEAISPKMKRK